MATRRKAAGTAAGTGGEELPPAPPGKKWVKKRKWWQCGPVKCFLLVVAAIFVLNFASLKREATALLPEGELYDIGWGQKLFMRCKGRGTPVVVLDAPIGEISDIWIRIEPLLTKHTKVCVYDRAGLGFSDRAYKNTSSYAQDYSKEAKRRDALLPGTVERMTDDLHRLLQKAVGTDIPLLLVGVDYSTLISRFYAQFYENEVVSLVLIDPMVETIFDNNSTWSHYWYNEVQSHVNILYLSAVIGLNRLALLTGLMKPIQDQKVIKLVDDKFINRRKYLMCNSAHVSSVIDEIYLTNSSLSQIKTVFKVKPFPKELPIAMATFKDTGTLGTELTRLWKREQDTLSNIHPQIKRYIIPGGDHNSLYHYPQSIATIIVNSIQQWRRNNNRL